MNPQLLEYVRQQRVTGLSDETIKQNLLTSGWTLADVEAALSNNQPQAIIFTTPNSSPDISSSKMTLLLWVVGGLVVLGVGAYYIISHQSLPTSNQEQQTQPVTNEPGQTQNKTPQASTVQESAQALPNTPTPTIATTLQCSGIKIQLPEKWSNLEPAKSSQLGTDGCYRDNTGCLCAKKDPVDPTAKLLFAVLIAPYPAGVQVEDFVNIARESGTVSEVKKYTFSGFPAIQFMSTGINKSGLAFNHGTFIFLKDQKLYQFDLSGGVDTISDMWPDFVVALQGTKF